MVVGTPGYMAPEQVFGEAVGASADIFSLGCVLYEMLSGRRPFDRDTPAETFGAILYAPTPALASSASPMPAALDGIVRHCLEKDPAQRFASARDVASALYASTLDSSPATPTQTRAAGGRASRPRSHSLAVLPFAASGDAADLGFLGEGVAEGVINAVAGVKGVRVIPRTLSFRHAGRESQPRAVGVELNSEMLLSGRLVVRGDQLQVQAELVDTSDESQIWGSRFVRPAADLEIVSRLLADQVCEAVTGRYRTRIRKPRAARKRQADTTAYREYLRGRSHWNRWTRDGLLAAIDAFKASAAADPGYALAFAGLADAYGGAGFYGYLPIGEAMPLAHEAAVLAVKFDPGLAEAHAVLGVEAMFFHWDWAAAERHLTKALALDAHSLTALVYYSLFLACRGRGVESLEHARRAERVDPLSLLALSSVAWGLLHKGDIEGAEAQLHRMLGIDPEFPEALIVLARLAEARGDFASAVDYQRRWFPSMGLRADEADLLWHAFDAGGCEAYWRACLEVFSHADASCPATPLAAAAMHLRLGETDAALSRLERAVEMRLPMLAFLGVDMQFVALHGEPRFQAILSRIGLA
jgi:TolB-like protein/Tfp pilus assembly protein PilF